MKVAEGKTISFEVTALNALNQRAEAAVNESIDSWQFPHSTRPGGYSIAQGAPAYQAYEGGYDPATIINARHIVKNSQYGQPYLFQNGRSIRLGLKFNF